MALPKTTLWTRGSHTEGKHLVLEYYLNAWFPILGMGNRNARILDELDEQERRMAPALVMMDPFGIKGIPISVIQRILGNPKCEVYVTFMWEAINKCMTTPEFEHHMTGLFGTDEWKKAILLSGRERQLFLHRLYRRQLKAHGAGQVVHFHLLEGNQLRYSIFFGTGHTRGSDRMKTAIWKADPTGDFRFRGGEQAQISFLDPDFAPLQEALKERFEGPDGSQSRRSRNSWHRMRRSSTPDN